MLILTERQLQKHCTVWHIGALAIEKVGYQGTVLPVLAAAAILAFVEKKLHKKVS